MTLGERISKARKLAGLSQEELANKIGSTKQNISKYERDITKKIPPDVIEKIANALNTTPSGLVGWSDVSIRGTFDSEAQRLSDLHNAIIDILPLLGLSSIHDNGITMEVELVQQGIVPEERIKTTIDIGYSDWEKIISGIMMDLEHSVDRGLVMYGTPNILKSGKVHNSQ